jgi:polar amino acid transport system substrate-binding protein
VTTRATSGLLGTLLACAACGLAACGLAACGLPHDADGTLDRVRGGTLRVGVLRSAPWVTDSLGTLGGVEVRLVNDLARTLGARVTWIRQPEGQLMEALHARELDLVIGGLTAAEPWAKQVAFTHPYHVDTVGVGVVQGTVTRTVVRKHVLAAPPGENAWLVHVERFLRARKPTIATMLQEAGG